MGGTVEVMQGASFVVCYFRSTLLNVLGTELVPMREGLLMMGFKGYTRFLLETDSKEAVAMLTELWSGGVIWAML